MVVARRVTGAIAERHATPSSPTPCASSTPHSVGTNERIMLHRASIDGARYSDGAALAPEKAGSRGISPALKEISVQTLRLDPAVIQVYDLARSIASGTISALIV